MSVNLIVYCLCFCCPANALQLISSGWQIQRDDLTEYHVDYASTASSKIVCASLAKQRHQAVSFSPADNTCRMLICRLGWSGCRKCRNARNSSMPLLIVRRLGSLGGACWLTFQHRVDASVDFYRKWTAYVSEFGQGEDRNFWLGLEAIHKLTQFGDRRVRWEMSSWNGSWWWWENEYFAVQGAAEGYRVSVGAQVVNRSNVYQCPTSSALFMNNQKFSTWDNDQDSIPNNCAVLFRGAWWYNACHCFNPNGQYFEPPTAFNLSGYWAQGISFSPTALATLPSPLDYTYSMKTFECLVMEFNVFY